MFLFGIFYLMIYFYVLFVLECGDFGNWDVLGREWKRGDLGRIGN
jgi:hypothetical protein